MRVFNSLVTGLFDLLFLPFSSVPPLIPLLLFSVLSGIFMLLAFRYCSNQQAVRRARERLGAHLLEVRLFQTQVPVVLRAYGKILRASGFYFLSTLRPLAVMLIPLAAILVQLDLRFGNRAALPGESILVKAFFNDGAAAESAELILPEGARVTAPPLHIPDEKEVDWRIEGSREAEFIAEVRAAGESFPKTIRVARQTVRLSSARPPASWLEQFLHPCEPPLPADAALRSITVAYPPRELVVFGWKVHWLVMFFVVSLLAAYSLKGVLRTEI